MAFRAGTTTAFYLTTAAGVVTNLSPYADTVASDHSAAQLDVSAFGTAAKAYIIGQGDGQITMSGPLDVTLNTLLSTLYTAGSTASFIYGPGGSVASQARIAGSVNVASYNVSTSGSGRVEYSCTLQITGVPTFGTF